MTVNEFYQKVDGDYTDAINRLQSDVLIRKFLKMLPGDNSMTCGAYAEGNGTEPKPFCSGGGLFRDDGAAARQGGASCGNRAVL